MDQRNRGILRARITAHLTIRRRARRRDAIDSIAAHSAPRRSAGTWPTTASASCTRISKLNGGALMLNDDFPEFARTEVARAGGFVLHLQVPDADAAWQRALDAGSEVRFPMADQFWRRPLRRR